MRALTPPKPACKHGYAIRPDSASPLRLCRMLTEQKPVSPTAHFEKAPVLVVDDEYGPRESIAFSLSTEFAVETAERAKEALAKIKARKYATVVLDIRMPEMDGIKALEELRK